LTDTNTAWEEGGGEIVPAILGGVVVKIVMDEALNARVEACFSNACRHNFVV